MPACIPIHYAPQRASALFTTFRALTEVNENTAIVDAIKNCLVSAGWTQTGSVQASGGLFFLVGLPAIGSGISQLAMTFNGNAYFVYDSTSVPPPTGMYGSLVIIAVPQGGTSDDTMKGLCAAATSTNFLWSFLDSNNIRVDALLTGTAGNGYPIGGQFGASGSCANGGWTLTSAAANGISSVMVSISGGGGSAGVTLTVEGISYILSTLFFSNSYRLYANSYQLAIFVDGSTTEGPTIFGCAPYVYPAYVSSMGATKFVSSFKATVLGDPLGYNAAFAQTADKVICAGVTRTSTSINNLLRRYPDGNGLLTSSGKTIADENILMLPNAAGNLVAVGAIWDVWIETAEMQPEVDNIEYDGHNWRVMLSEGGGNGGFNHRSTGTMWLAIS